MIERGAPAARLYQVAAESMSAGQLDAAIEAYRQCAALDPNNAAVLNNLAVALIRAGRFTQAIAALRQALSVLPDYPRALTNLGKALYELGDPREAINALQRARAVAPEHVPTLINLGESLSAVGELEQAERSLLQAVALVPKSVEALMALGVVQLQRGDTAAALQTLRTAVELAPAHPEAHANLAHALYCSGCWQEAWPQFEYRFAQARYRRHNRAMPAMPRWDGVPHACQELYVVGEQGLGDQLQFARYATCVRTAGMRVTLACDPRLVALLTHAQLADDVVPFTAATQGRVASYVPLMSLPGWHHTSPHTVPFPDGYLRASPERVARWRERLSDCRGLRVAINWAGNPAMETGRYAGRSIPLAALAPVLGVPGTTFISVQKGTAESELAGVDGAGLVHRLDGLDVGADAFLDTAAVLQCVDLLISCDTGVAHLAGALGVPAWLCLMHEPDWRWMRAGDTTPWYNSIRLFRQSAPSDWHAVTEHVAAALRAHTHKTLHCDAAC